MLQWLSAGEKQAQDYQAVSKLAVCCGSTQARQDVCANMLCPRRQWANKQSSIMTCLCDSTTSFHPGHEFFDGAADRNIMAHQLRCMQSANLPVGVTVMIFQTIEIEISDFDGSDIF